MLPYKLKSRIGFILAGGILALIYISYALLFGSVDQSDHLPMILSASLAGPLFGALLWPRGRRSKGLMIFLGILIMALIIWAANFGIGFFSEREIDSRAAGGAGTVVTSALGALLMGGILTFFDLMRSFGLLILIGGGVGWLFRNKHIAANDTSR